MERVIGLGGIFFKARNPEKLNEWYRKHLGLNVEDWGGREFPGRCRRRTHTAAQILHRLVALRGRYAIFRAERQTFHDQLSRARSRRDAGTIASSWCRSRRESRAIGLRKIRVAQRSGRNADRAMGTTGGGIDR